MIKSLREVWCLVSIAMLVPLLPARAARGQVPESAFGAFRKRVVAAAVGQVGRVRDAPRVRGEKQGADQLVKIYREAWQTEYRSYWEPTLRRVRGRLHGWTGVFAVWCIVAAGRSDVSWGLQSGGGGPKGLGKIRPDVENMRPGDIVVFGPGRLQNVHAILEQAGGGRITVIQGDAFEGGVEQNIVRRTFPLQRGTLWRGPPPPAVADARAGAAPTGADGVTSSAASTSPGPVRPDPRRG